MLNDTVTKSSSHSIKDMLHFQDIDEEKSFGSESFSSDEESDSEWGDEFEDDVENQSIVSVTESDIVLVLEKSDSRRYIDTKGRRVVKSVKTLAKHSPDEPTDQDILDILAMTDSRHIRK